MPRVSIHAAVQVIAVLTSAFQIHPSEGIHCSSHYVLSFCDNAEDTNDAWLIDQAMRLTTVEACCAALSCKRFNGLEYVKFEAAC